MQKSWLSLESAWHHLPSGQQQTYQPTVMGQRGMQKCGIQLFPRRHEPTCQHHQQAKSSPSSDRTLGAYLCTRHLPWLAGRSGSGRAGVGAIAIAASSGVNPMDRQKGARRPCGHNDTREKRQAVYPGPRAATGDGGSRAGLCPSGVCGHGPKALSHGKRGNVVLRVVWFGNPRHCQATHKEKNASGVTRGQRSSHGRYSFQIKF